MNHYQKLGLSTLASTAEICEAYRKLALKYHPDRPSGSADKFKEITEAYAVLGDPHKKFRYDQSLPKPKTSKPRNRDGTIDYSQDPNLGRYGTPAAPTHDLWGRPLSPEERRQWLEDATTPTVPISPQKQVARRPRKVARRPQKQEEWFDAFASQYQGDAPEIR